MMKILQLFAILLMGMGTCTKVLELTKKNLPNVLRSHKTIYTLFHHSQCENSRQYHQQFIKTQHSTSTVGIIDCSQQNNLCAQYKVKNCPTLMILKQSKNQEEKEAQIVNQQGYLHKNGLPSVIETDQYKTSELLRLLKQDPHYVVVLFEQVGLPVMEKQKINDERVFYLSQGRLSQAMNAFVGHRSGCWIFENKNTEKLTKFYCGDTYQPQQNLRNIIQKYRQGKMTRTTFDSSNYEDNRIIGYNELQYKFSHQHNFMDQCYLIYVWSEKCSFCDFEDDEKTIKRSLQISNKDWRWFSYNTNENEIPPQIQIKLLPNMVKICPDKTENEKVEVKISYLNKIITIKNLVKFISEEQQEDNVAKGDQL